LKYAILGDIHSNLEALNAVLDDSREQGVTHYCCVGDVVGYNANPVECLDIVRDLCTKTVRGNHDHYCSHRDNLDGFHPLAADVVDWTRKQLKPEDVEFLRGLQYVAPVETFTIVHSTLDTPEMWGYVFDKLEAEANFNYQSTSICFYGHTHVPLAFEKADSIRCGLYSRVRVSMGKKYFINVGSVGQPRDGDPRSAYVIFDMVNNIIELRRVEYDYTKTQEKILDAGLPSRVAARLAVGR
jgi:predicted phosphodiesterase